MLQESDPVRAAPLILKTTLRHLRFVNAFDLMLFAWPPVLGVAIPYLCIKQGKLNIHLSLSQKQGKEKGKTIHIEW